MKAILGLGEDHGAVAFHHVLSNLQSAIRGQTVHHDAVGGGVFQERVIDLVAGEIGDAFGFFRFLAHGNPCVGVKHVGFTDSFDAKIKTYNYFDVAVNWKIHDVAFRAGMNNIFDKDPPVVDANNIGIAGVAQFGNGNTYPGVYDTLGRTVFIGLTADF